MKAAVIRAFAKINLDLRVLGLGADGYHELRTVFQTISLADTIEISFEADNSTTISVTSDVEIPGSNLIERAAAAVLEAAGRAGRVEMRLTKKIPIGAGLGGGSSDAAAVLMALPVLAGFKLPVPKLMELGRCLGSDVPFFLLGGTAAGLARGTELYPLPERRPDYGVVVAPGIHVSTAEAYRELDRERTLTSDAAQNIISSFQSCIWDVAGVSPDGPRNDFESVVFARHSELKSLKGQLELLGAQPALLSGSGSALFGIFRGKAEAERARASIGKERVFPIRLVTRARYRDVWWRQLQPHIAERVWPPQSRYA